MTPAQPAPFARLTFTLLALSASALAWASNSTATAAESPPASPTPDLPLDAAFTTVPGRLAGLRYPASIEALQGKGYRVGNVFDGGAPGLTGWLLSRPGARGLPFVVYTVEGREDIYIQGDVRNAEGESLTTAQLRTAAYPVHERHPNLWESLEANTAWVATGPSDGQRKAVVYLTYSGASCPRCARVREALRPFEQAGLQVRWVLATRNDNDQLVGAHILSAPDPSAALAQHFDNPLDPGSFLAQPDARTGQRFSETSRVLRHYTISATPILVFKDRAGKTFSIAAEAALPHLSAITQVQP
jgi:thiol:disulfide interchange protein DsbG